MKYDEYDIQTACNIATGDDETTGKEVRKQPKRLQLMKNKSKTFKFRSGLEVHIAEQLDRLGVDYDYEAKVIEWLKALQKTRYTPDFLLPNGIFLEGKGQFLTSDRKRHRQIKAQFKNKYDIRFIFSNPNRTVGKKSTTRYRDWCDRYGFKWSNQDVPIAWIKEKKKIDEKI